MPFNIRNLSVLAYANGFTLWHYKSGNDTVAQVSAKDYFNNAADMLTRGDTIHISGANGAGIRHVALGDRDNVILEQLI